MYFGSLNWTTKQRYRINNQLRAGFGSWYWLALWGIDWILNVLCKSIQVIVAVCLPYLVNCQSSPPTGMPQSQLSARCPRLARPRGRVRQDRSPGVQGYPAKTRIGHGAKRQSAVIGGIGFSQYHLPRESFRNSLGFCYLISGKGVICWTVVGGRDCKVIWYVQLWLHYSHIVSDVPAVIVWN